MANIQWHDCVVFKSDNRAVCIQAPTQQVAAMAVKCCLQLASLLYNYPGFASLLLPNSTGDVEKRFQSWGHQNHSAFQGYNGACKVSLKEIVKHIPPC